MAAYQCDTTPYGDWSETVYADSPIVAAKKYAQQKCEKYDEYDDLRVCVWKSGVALKWFYITVESTPVYTATETIRP